ncbi:lytic murein transglycosylase B [Methylibium rhizosphaerae]|uniref:lytic murein transglycosylase B n=1 Tax=Methylibium rhizosphaerae TaxID=2570323 RepID=UPI0011292276|nr:lytic murein transglycosylase B [Methylibium rhizosphaerae]
MSPLTRLRLALVLGLAAALTAPVLTQAAPKKQPRHKVQSDQAPDVVTYGRRDDVMALARHIAERQNLEVQWVSDTLAQARYLPNVAKLIMPPPAGTAKDWSAYRARFIEPTRLRAGVEFWRDNERWLRAAEEKYGVPADIVVGIVGVETLYGRHMGGFRVIDALATLSFDFPTGRKDRSPFFRDELEQFFVLCHKGGIDPLSLKGSYAGALGMPQFMPSSWNKYAVDFDGDGRVDLHASSADVIGSVAHYLAEFGWQRGMPTHYEVAAPVEVVDRAVLLVPDIVPSFTPAQFAERGAALPEAARQHNGLLALVELQNGDAAPSYVAGTANFYAVTRYNWSSYYALAVIELGRAVANIVAATVPEPQQQPPQPQQPPSS